MRRVLIAIGVLGAFGVGCTAFIAANLSGTQGTVHQSLGGCFDLDDNICGQCIANSCENPNGSQPVSLAQVCSLDQYSPIALSARECSRNPSYSNYNCQDMYIDGGTYASSIDTESAAVNNLQHCITDKCATSCNQCAVQVPTCQSDTVTLVEAGTCGSCLDQAMNGPKAPCQPLVKDGCYESSSSPTAQCAIPTGACSTPDCSILSSPPSNYDDAAVSFFQCLWQECSGSCPSQ